jgi:hypothetical protein
VANLGQSTNAFGFYIACTVSATIGSSSMGTQASMLKKAINYLRELKNNNLLTQERHEEISKKLEIME